MRPLAVIFALALITIAFEIYSNPRWRTRRSLTLLPRSRDCGHRPWPQTRLVSALHTDELKIAAALSDAEPLQEELKDFQRKVSGRGEGDLQCPHGCSRRLGAGDRDPLWWATSGPVTSIEPFPLV
jgi:hypothetical protein